ncbi:MAG TPA: DMT family transporter [Pyrinomonadaceae bacterium]|nr:DMT family transporter [Pyrinomonadaceae bacterium]
MDNKKSQRPAFAYTQVALGSLAAGLWSLFLRPAGIDPYWSAAIVMGTIGIVCAPLLLKSSARLTAGERKLSDWWFIVLLGIFAAGNALLYFTALKTTTVATAVLSHCLAPVIVAVAAPTILGTPRRWRTIILALSAAVGLAIMLEPWRGGTGESSVRATLTGAAWGVGAAVFISGFLLVNKLIGTRFTAEERLVYHAVVAAPLLLIAAFMFNAPLPPLNGAAIVAAGGATVGAIGGLLFLRGLNDVPAENAGVFTLIEPLTGLLVAWLVWGESFGIISILGAAILVISGVMVVSEPEKNFE